MAITLATSLAAKAIGAACCRRRRLPDNAQDEDEQGEEDEDDDESGCEPSEFEMKNMSPSTEGAQLDTPKAKPERHDPTPSPIIKEPHKALIASITD